MSDDFLADVRFHRYGRSGGDPGLGDREHSLCGRRRAAPLAPVSFTRDCCLWQQQELSADRAPRRCTRRVGADILSLILHVTEFLPPPAISEMEWTRDGSLQTTGGPDAGHVCCVCAVAQLCLTL